MTEHNKKHAEAIENKAFDDLTQTVNEMSEDIKEIKDMLLRKSEPLSLAAGVVVLFFGLLFLVIQLVGWWHS